MTTAAEHWRVRLHMETGYFLSTHAWCRAHERSIGLDAIRIAIAWGRKNYVRGARVHTIGRKEIKRLRCEYNIDASRFEGVQVVCEPGENVILTVYRHRNLRALRPRTRRHNHRRPRRRHAA